MDGHIPQPCFCVGVFFSYKICGIYSPPCSNELGDSAGNPCELGVFSFPTNPYLGLTMEIKHRFVIAQGVSTDDVYNMYIYIYIHMQLLPLLLDH